MNLKKMVSKSIALFMVTTILFGNFSMCGMGISKVIAENLAAPEIEIQMENQKYVQYSYTETVKEEVKGENEGETVMQDVEKQIAGVAVQSKLSVRPIQVAEAYLPTQSINLSVSMPRINEYLPVRAIVVGASTKYTTGEENKNINQSYDATTGLLSVSYENVPDEEGNIYANFNENAKDKFEIIYIYPAEAYVGNEADTVLNYTVYAEMIFVTENGTVESILEETIGLTEKDNKEDLASFKVTDLKQNIYKGFMYSNIENKTSYDTEYTTVSTFAVLNSDIAKETLVEENANQLILKGEEKVVVYANENIVYNSTKILKSEFDKILGQENSFVEFYQGEEVFARVNYVDVDETKKIAITYKDAEPIILEDGANEIIVNHQENTTNLKIKLSKPIAEGFMNFENQNKINASEDYGYSVEDIKSILVTTTINENVKEAELKLSEPTTKVSINSSNVNFSTLQPSATTLTINLDDTNIATKLFNAPTLTIKLPEGIEKFDVTKLDLLNGNGLNVKKANKENNIITIELEGKQTNFDLTNVSGGTNIVIDIENIEYADTIATHSDKIELTCSQDNTKADCNVNIVSKPGLLMLSKVIYNREKENLHTTLENNTIVIQAEEDKERKEVNQEVILVNNYDKNLTDVQIIGKIGYSNENEDILSTFETILTKPIEINNENAKVYYSKNTDASYDDDSWQEEYTSEARLYKVVLNNREFESKRNLKLNLSLEVPEKLQYNQSTYINTRMDYTYETQRIYDENIIKIETPKIETLPMMSYLNDSNITVGVTTTAGENVVEDGNEVYEGQILKTKLEIVNNSRQDVKYTVRTLIENAVYYELYETGEIYNQTGDPQTRYGQAAEDDVNREYEVIIPAISTKTIEYQYVVRENVEFVNNNIKVFDENNNVINESKVSNKVNPAEMKMWFEYAYNEEYIPYSKLNVKLSVKNYENKALENIMIETDLSRELIPFDYECYGAKNVELEYDTETHKMDIKLDKIPKNETIDLIIRFNVDIENNLTEKIVNLSAKCNYKGKTYLSNDFSKKVYQGKTNLSMNISSNLKSEQVRIGDEFVYTVNITNSGAIELNNSNMKFVPAKGMVVKNAQIIYTDNTKETIDIGTDFQIEKEINIKDGDNITFKYNIKVEDTTEKMESKFVLTDTYFNTIRESSILTGIIETIVEDEDKDESYNPDVGDGLVEEDDLPGTESGGGPEESKPEQPTPDGQKPEQPIPESTVNKYSISGQVWLDSNKNGQKDSDEILMNNIQVSLVDKATGKFAVDESGNRIITTTNSNGEYKFENVKEGTYIVVFEIDTNKYVVTTYQKTNINEDINSDAILAKVNIDEQNKLAGVTDNIELKSDKANIDIGLMENAIFDLSLDKSITKVTVINVKGTETTEYEDGETAKVDLVAKYMNGAEVIVTYKFAIKNEGDTVGYVDKLVDNLPSGLEFSSELNSDWYKGSDNQLYTTSLSGKAIKPGQTTEVELVLTKKMTENNTGVFPNNAELVEISNLENIKEKEDALENNRSSAMLIISIKTGSVILYTGITIISILIIAAGAYMIKKKILNRGI